MDIPTIAVAIASCVGSLAGSFGGVKLIAYRVEQLEKKVDKHNNVIERVYKLEEAGAVTEEKLKVCNHRLDDLERGHAI